MTRNNTLLSVALALAVSGLALPAAAAPIHPHATTSRGVAMGGSGATTRGNGGGCPGRPGGGPGAGLISGTITAIDTTAGTITITPTSGTASTITLTSSTVLIGHETIAASAIALGDTLDVSGIPVTLQAVSIVDNHLPAPSSGSGSSSGGPSSGGGTPPSPGSLHVMGVVTALSPPTITVDSSFSVTLSVTSDTTYAELLPLTASQLATGEAAVAHVSKSKTGTLTALHVDVTPASS